ncbi:MAG: response regulator [Pricia sp.]
MNQNTPLLIALVDDDIDDREIFEEALEEVSPETRIRLFDNGAHLLDYLGNNDNDRPHIIFLDINMPVKNGFETLSELQESEEFKGLCVIMYSTSDSRTDIEKSYLLGANGFVQKASSHSALKNMLSKILTTDWKDPCNALERHNFVLTAE